MTHEDLRRRAVQWLTNTKRCSVVLSELSSAAFEIPDAIGWRCSTSYLVECKVSRNDFNANKSKPHTRSTRGGMGRYRYFLTPPKLISERDLVDIGPDEVQEQDYGLLWCEEYSTKVMKEAIYRPTINIEGETAMLVSALRRVRTREFLTIVQESSASLD
jgi:hypothetical protein